VRHSILFIVLFAFLGTGCLSQHAVAVPGDCLDVRCVARHEAGHAAAAWLDSRLAAFNVSGVTVFEDPYGSHGETGIHTPKRQLTADEALSMAAMTAAGTMNEDVSLRREPLNTDGDADTLENYAKLWCRLARQDEGTACRASAKVLATTRARSLLQGHRSQVAALAKMLAARRKVGAKELQEILGSRS
jgi:ATP-dependent Zn protease